MLTSSGGVRTKTTSTRKRALLLTLAIAGCVTVSKSVLMDRSAHPVPQERVQVLLEGLDS